MSSKKPDHGLENYRLPDQFGNWLGYQIVKLDREKRSAEVSLKIREDHLSSAGRVHGGVISAFLDYACGGAVFSTMQPKDYCSTVELKVNYFKPIELKDELIARTEVKFRGKRLCVVHGLLFRNAEAEPVAMATATFNIINGKA